MAQPSKPVARSQLPRKTTSQLNRITFVTGASLSFCFVIFIIIQADLFPSFLTGFTSTFASQSSPSPPTGAAFLLRARSVAAPLDGKYINACGGFFWIGRETCAICPGAAGESGCRSVMNKTILTAGGVAMNLVPGGQHSFLSPPSGALAYISPHSLVMPASAGPPAFSVTGAASDGSADRLFTHSGGNTRWIALPEYQGENQIWKIYAPQPGVGMIAVDMPLEIVAEAVEPGVFGAWQF